MGNLTAKQVNELANNFLALAQAVGDYRYENYNSITATENQNLSDLHWSILNYADDLYTLSATIVMADVGPSLTTIWNITEEIKATYKKLQNVQKAINVAASVVALGASILSKNPQAITDSIGGLIETWSS